MASKFIRLRTVQDRTAKGKTCIYQEISEGLFPKPVKIGKRMVAWLESDIDDWIQQRIDESLKIDKA